MRPLPPPKLAAWLSLPLVALGVTAAAQEAAPYCAELDRIAGLANTTEKFSAIAGPPRDGDFSDTTLPLGGWVDCSVYGPRTYSCDSVSYGSTAAAEKAIEEAAQQIATCPGGAWRRRPQQSSPSYQILTHAKAPISMTLSTAESGDTSFVIRLIVFTRRD
ncbi:MAG TPA: hypothetical protein VGB82_18745 [Alphaproteobacteria bacterium]